MPVRKCLWPSCDVLLRRGASRGYCETHQPRVDAERNRKHDSTRCEVRFAFYRSRAWAKLSKVILDTHPVCQRCHREPSRDVHHTAKLSTPRGWEARLDPAGLLAVCRKCHRKLDLEATSIT